MSKRVNTKRGLVVAIIGILIGLLVLGLIIAGLFISSVGKTEGTHKGIVTAVETNSFIFTKKRAYVKTSAEATQEDQYCVKDNEIYSQLQEVSETGQVVILHFSHPLIEWVWNCQYESAIITGVTK